MAPYQAGQVIQQEEAWQWSLTMEATADHCYFCLKSLHVSSDSIRRIIGEPMKNDRCSGCRHARYCSLECQKTDWKDTHKLICQTLKQFAADGTVLSEETSLFLKVIAKCVQSPASVAALRQLSSPRLALRREAILQRGGSPSLRVQRKRLLDILHVKEEQKAAVSFEDFVDMFARIEHFAKRIEGSRFNQTIGLGIYLKASTSEHSCAPNACLTFVNRRVRVMALENIENLDQFLISFLDTLLPLEWRQKALKADFHLDCDCVSCVDPVKDAERFCMPCINKKCDAEIPSDQRASHACKCGAQATTDRLVKFRRLGDEVDQWTESKCCPTEDAGGFGRLEEKMIDSCHRKNPLWAFFYAEQFCHLSHLKRKGSCPKTCGQVMASNGAWPKQQHH